MPLPERLRPVHAGRKKLKEMEELLDLIVDKIDSGATENDSELKKIMDNWNNQVAVPSGFSDFRDFYSWTSAKDFTRMSFNKEKYWDDLTWLELLDILKFIRSAEGRESDQTYAINLLEENFKANPLDLIYWPAEWFNDEKMRRPNLTTEELAGYLMMKSGRWLSDAPDIELKYPIPESVYD